MITCLKKIVGVRPQNICRRTIIRRLDGEAARAHYPVLLRHSTLPNLLDNCPPVAVISGN